MDDDSSLEQARPSVARQLTIFTLLTILDICFNSAAGAAAAATGAHVNSQSDSATAHNEYDLGRILRLGTLAGLMKSGILSFASFGSYFGGWNIGMWLILVLVSSGFGICVLIVTVISNATLGNVPGGLLISAIVTAIPLGNEMVGIQILPDSEIIAFFLIGLDALSGYVFARMAHNEGYDICAYNAAAAAGAVYGTLTCVKALITWCIKGPNKTITIADGVTRTTTITNNFGTRTVRDIDYPGIREFR